VAGEKILAVDKEIYYRSFYQDFFTAEGYLLQLAENGRAALAALMRDRFDLLIADDPPQGITREELLEEARKRDPLLPVVFAGPPSLQQALLALRKGAADYLNKPLVVEELRSTVRSVLDRSRKIRERMFSLSPGLEGAGILETLQRCKEILSSREGDALFSALLDLALEKTDASKGALLWLAPDRSSYVPRAHRGLAQPGTDLPCLSPTQGVVGTLIARGTPMILGPVLEKGPSSSYLGEKSTLILPLERRKQVRGGLVLADKVSDEPFSDRDLRSLIPLAALVAGGLEDGEGEAMGKGGISLERLVDQATLQALVDKETKRSRRYGKGFCLLLIRFQELEDILVKSIPRSREDIHEELMDSLLGIIRSSDVAGLLEGGEVALLTPETDYQGGIATARRIRRAIQSLPWLQGLSFPSPFPLSFGIASFPEQGSSANELLRRAHLAMKRAVECASRFESLWGYVDQLLNEARIISDLLGALYGRREAQGGEELGEMIKDSEQPLPTGELSRELQYVASEEELVSFLQYIEQRVLERLAGEGILYVGAEEVGRLPGKLERYLRMRENGIKVFLFTRQETERGEEELGDLALVVTGDPALSAYSFCLYYGVSACYGLVGRQREGEAMGGFFTISDFLVNELMGKITETYL